MQTGDRVRIKKGVKPYGGRLVTVDSVHQYPNGRQVVRVHAPLDNLHRDIREYNADEVEERL